MAPSIKDHIWHHTPGLKNLFFFKKKAQPSRFGGFYWVFLDKQEKIGKIIQKLSNLSLKSFKTIKYCIISGV